LVSFGHCIVCPSLNYGFWLPLWYLLGIELIYGFWLPFWYLLITPLVSSNCKCLLSLVYFTCTKVCTDKQWCPENKPFCYSNFTHVRKSPYYTQKVPCVNIAIYM